ncbi:MAG: transcriptional regulator [Actinomycetota bacterium]
MTDVRNQLDTASDEAGRTAWTFLSNHARVLSCLADDSSIRLRDVAAQVGITERAAQSIVADLATSGFVTRTRVGRRNRYEVHRERGLGEGPDGLAVGALLELLAHQSSTTRSFADDDLADQRGRAN